jgi:hypothetical protein
MPKQDTHRRLYEFLKECELEKRHFTLDAVANTTALSEVSVRTYLSKKLLGRCVERIDEQHFAARGIARMPWADFQSLMSQKAPPPIADQTAWTESLRRLVDDGRAQGYPVAEILEGILKSVAKV